MDSFTIVIITEIRHRIAFDKNLRWANLGRELLSHVWHKMYNSWNTYLHNMHMGLKKLRYFLGWQVQGRFNVRLHFPRLRWLNEFNVNQSHRKVSSVWDVESILRYLFSRLRLTLILEGTAVVQDRSALTAIIETSSNEQGIPHYERTYMSFVY